MLATATERSPLLALLAALLLTASLLTAFLFSGCAVVPKANYPPHSDGEIAVRCLVPESGRLRVPSTSPSLVVHSLAAEPAPHGEVFGPDGARWLLFDAGTNVLVRTRIRIYRDSQGRIAARDRAGLFPEAIDWSNHDWLNQL